MEKKFLIFLFLFSVLFIQYYFINKKNKKICNLNEKINIFENNIYDYKDLYYDVNKNNIGEKTNLLRQSYKENDEEIKLLENNINNLNMNNNELEQKIIKIEETNNLNGETFILDKQYTYNQFPTYPTGCESVALYLLLKYNNLNINIEEIVNALKKGELPYKIGEQLYGGNPELEFIGDPKTKYSYGVYNKPLVDVANQFKSGIISKIGLEFEEMLEIVKNGKAVLVWTTINLKEPFISRTWIYKPTMEKINWISGEHAVVVIGYNDKKIIVSDPYTGTIRYFDKDLFKLRYNYLGKRVLYY